MISPIYDTVIIGGGPGGLTAALYLRRFRRNVIVIDKGNTRLQLIPVTHNFPGFPDGIRGPQLLDNLRRQVSSYGTTVIEGEVLTLRRDGELFVAEYNDQELRALTVLLATGIADAGMPIADWNAAVTSGAVRLCPICDGFDVIDRRIAVVSSESDAVGHSLFLRNFSTSVTLFELDELRLNEGQRRKLDDAKVRYVLSPLKCITMSENMTPVLHTQDDAKHHFDVVYPMLGETARSDLALSLGAKISECMALEVDDYQSTSVPGLYAVGDVVQGLNQISIAAGHAAVAATRIHNLLPPRY